MTFGPQLVLVSGGLKIFSWHPGGTKVDRLNSCRPSKTWYADSSGWVRGLHIIFNVSCDCLINLHHSTVGKCSSHVLKTTIV